MIIINAMTDN